MSRIGKQPVLIPQGVTVEKNGHEIIVNGPKGFLKIVVRPEIGIEIEADKVIVSAKNNNRATRALFGTMRSLIANMIEGVTEGFVKTLKIVGTGYRVKLESESGEEKLVLSLGFSHSVEVKAVEGIHFEVEGNDLIKIKGLDKAAVGQLAAKIRDIYPPEPYKGKGIRYHDENPKRKAGKAGKAGAGGAK
jgi:large subunit ribosomal protein L6